MPISRMVHGSGGGTSLPSGGGGFGSAGLDLIGGGISALGSIAGSAISSASQARDVQRTNDMNERIAKAGRDWSSGQADAQMNFQEKMSNTAYQRAVRDLQSAGLNPLLAMPGAASSPSGAMGSGSNANMQAGSTPNTLGNAIKGLSSSAVNLRQLSQTLDGKDAEISATRAAALASVASADNASSSAAVQKAKLAGVKAGSDVASERAKYDKMAAPLDAVGSRILKGIGGAVDAVNIRRILMGSPGGRGGSDRPSVSKGSTIP